MIHPDQIITDRKWMAEVIRSCSYGTLGINGGDTPYTIPLCFGLDKESLYFHGLDSGRKIDLLRSNPAISFLFVRQGGIEEEKNPCDWGIEYASVMGTGEASFMETVEAKQYGLSCIMNQYTRQTFHFSEKQMKHTAVIKVDIKEICGKKSS